MSTTSPEKCYYEELGIKSNASDAEVNVAYKRLAMIRHPDKNPQDPQATEHFQLLQAAYEVLSHPEKRSDYDRSLLGLSTEPGVHEIVDISAEEMTEFLHYVILNGVATTHHIRKESGRKQKELPIRLFKDMDRARRRWEQLKQEREIIEEKESKLAEEKAKVVAKEKREAEERAAQFKIWEEKSATTDEEQQSLCIHSDVWCKNTLRKKFKCGTCGKKRGVVSFQCSYCNLLACQVCLNKFRQEKHLAGADDSEA